MFYQSSSQLKKRNNQLRKERILESRKKGTHTVDEWCAILDEVDGRCVRCKSETYSLQKDHIIPIYIGGSDGVDNLQPLCKSCNTKKTGEDFNWLEFRRKNGWTV
jgi:5-methylcytosine-specific restriction endonuclease McrA